MIRENKAKRKLMSGGIALGTFMAFTDPAIMEVLGRVGFDFSVLDDEHSHYDKSQLSAMMLAAEVRDNDIAPLVRIREGSVGAIKNALDMGALGIQVPMVDTYEQAKAIIEAAYYPPIGRRGLGSANHSAGYGFYNERMDYIRLANSEVLNVLQCESIESVNNLDAILSVPGVEVVFVGATDLACSMGVDVLADRRHPELLKTIDRAIKMIVDSGKVAGAPAMGAEEAKRLIDMGVRYLCIGSDLGYMRSAATASLKLYRDIVDKN